MSLRGWVQISGLPYPCGRHPLDLDGLQPAIPCQGTNTRGERKTTLAKDLSWGGDETTATTFLAQT